MAKLNQKIEVSLPINGSPITVTLYGDKVGATVNRLIGQCDLSPAYDIKSVTPVMGS